VLKAANLSWRGPGTGTNISDIDDGRALSAFSFQRSAYEHIGSIREAKLLWRYPFTYFAAFSPATRPEIMANAEAMPEVSLML
jgi:hypothetical protein